MKNFYDLSEQRKIDIFNQVSDRTGLPSAAIEKDWWVTMALKAIFELPYSEHIVFKGGTSLSKGWNLIERFSEDIDLALDRALLGYEGYLNKGQIRNLRKDSCKF
jgi:predicted nucleotidyltransferase component of viral defense system